MIDENRVAGTVREFGGRVQDAAGGLIGDSETQARGKVNELAGQAQQASGAAADGARDVGNRVVAGVREQPLGALVAVGIAGFIFGMLVSR